MHWFDDEERLSEVASRGYYVSFGPALLYSRKLQRMAREAPLGQILVESDGPVPYGALGPNVRGSFLIPSVIFAIAEIRGVDGGEIAAEVVKNTLRFLSGN
jgi:TatD DNase family protein